MYVFPDARDGRVIADVIRLGKGHTEGLEPRITLTYPALGSSRTVAFLVAGARKREILTRALADDETLPAVRVHSLGDTVWFADRAAAPP